MSKSKIELCILSIMRYEGNADFNIKKVETILSLKQSDLQILSEDNYLQKIFQMLICSQLTYSPPCKFIV